MTLAEKLRYHADEDRKEADRLIERAEEREAEARGFREKARTLRLDALEFTVGANIVEDAGLKVEMGPDGNPVVSINGDGAASPDKGEPRP